MSETTPGSAPEEPTTRPPKTNGTPGGAPLGRPILMRPSRNVVLGGVRGIIGLAVAALAVAVIVGASVVTEPRLKTQIPSVDITPVPAAKQRLCAGPVLRLGGSSGDQATVATSAGRPAVVTASVPDNASSTPLTSTDDAAGVAPESITLQPRSDEASVRPVLAAAQSEQVMSGTFAGFAANECLEPSGVAWLSAGATTVGRTTLIALSNPSSVAASVDLAFWGPTGPLSAPGSTGLIVPPGAQRVYPLAGFAPGIEQAVVRVTSRGGPIVATIHESIVRTLVAGGVDIVAPTQAPATEVHIPGLTVQDAEAVTGAQAALGFEDLQTVVRLLTPGTAPTRATISITPSRLITTSTPPASGRGEQPMPTTFSVGLEPGQVQDVPLPGLVDGSYSITVTSTTPVVASARVSTITPDGATDFAWLSAAAPLGDEALVAVPDGPNPTIQLSNPTGSDLAVTLETRGADAGVPQKVDVPAGTSVTVPVTARAVLTLRGAATLVGAIGFVGPGELAAYPISVPAANATSVRVYR